MDQPRFRLGRGEACQLDHLVKAQSSAGERFRDECIRWWRHGGRTSLDNLLLICSFHHCLVHEHGWSVQRRHDGTARWFRPDGRRFRAGPSPPSTALASLARRRGRLACLADRGS
jgi:hypothetical protein